MSEGDAEHGGERPEGGAHKAKQKTANSNMGFPRKNTPRVAQGPREGHERAGKRPPLEHGTA